MAVLSDSNIRIWWVRTAIGFPYAKIGSALGSSDRAGLRGHRVGGGGGGGSSSLTLPVTPPPSSHSSPIVSISDCGGGENVLLLRPCLWVWTDFLLGWGSFLRCAVRACTARLFQASAFSFSYLCRWFSVIWSFVFFLILFCLEGRGLLILSPPLLRILHLRRLLRSSTSCFLAETFAC